MERDKARIAFLIGSGVSIPGGLPSTEQITERVRQGTHSNKADLGKITAFIDIIAALFNESEKSKYPNYEELYFMIEQLQDTSRYHNPALYYFEKAVAGRLHQAPVTDTLAYIEKTVTQSLIGGGNDSGYHRFLVEAIEAYGKEYIDIYTLNHDTLIEKTLESERIPYCDGFPLDNAFGLRRWDGQAFSDYSNIRLLKLHGSVDWYDCQPCPPTQRIDLLLKVDKRASVAADLYEDLKGNRWFMAQPNQPRILIGTLNKILECTEGTFGHLYSLFWTELASSNILIIAGYGFNDTEVNNRILDWAYSDMRRIMVIINNDVNMLNKAKPQTRAMIMGYYRVPCPIKIIPKSICDVGWHEICAKAGL